MRQTYPKKLDGTFLIVPMLVSALMVWPGFSASAQTDNLKSAVQNATEIVGKAKEGEDFETHRQALQKVIDASIIRTNELIGRLTLLRNLESGLAELRDIHLASLESFVEHYDDVSASLNELQDLDAIKALAAELKSWRGLVFNPEIEKVIEFLLFFQGQNILNTANNRYKLISDDIVYFSDIKGIKNVKIQSLLSDARELLIAAAGFQLQVQNLLIATDTPKDVHGSDAPNIRSLVSSALLKVKAAYKNFLDISALLRSLVIKEK